MRLNNIQKMLLKIHCSISIETLFKTFLYNNCNFLKRYQKNHCYAYRTALKYIDKLINIEIFSPENKFQM